MKSSPHVGAFYVGVERGLCSDEVLALLRGWFPSLAVGEYRRALASDSPWPEVVFWLVENESEFSTVIDFVNFPCQEDTICVVNRELARRIADHFDCRSICAAVGFGHDPAHPGTSIVWDRGASFLASDYYSDFGDGEGGPVHIERQITVDSKADGVVLAKLGLGND